MTTVVVQAHPLAESYNAALLDAAVDGLRRAGSEPAVFRLCQGDSLDAAHLSDCTHLVAVVPTWWGAMPAVLLDWIQRELGPWIDGGRSIETSPLRTVERLTVVTSHGSSRLINTLQGEPGRQLWRRSVLRLCGPKARFDWVALYKIDRLKLDERQRFIETVRSSMA